MQTASRATWFLTIAAAVSGCGGGGGDGPAAQSPVTQPPPPTATSPQRPPAPTISYTGRSGPAVIETGNVNDLIADPVLMPVTVRRLVSLFNVQLSPVPADLQGPVNIEATRSGAGGGQATLRGIVDVGPQRTFTGWLWLEFDNFAEGGYIFDGRVVQDVRVPFTTLSHSIRMEFTELHLTEPHGTFALNGTVEDVHVNDASGDRRTVTANLTQRSLATGDETWAENLVSFSDRATLFSFDQAYSGRVHHSEHGYVDVFSDAPLSFINNEPQPDRGGPVRIRGANGSGGLIALNREYAAVLLDDDADGVDDRFARLGWQQLLSNTPARNTSSAAVANAGAKRAVTVGEAVELDGLLSHDSDASFLTVDWTLAIKPVGSMAALDFTKPLTPSFTPDLPGYYMFTLEVNDPDGDAYDSVIVQAVPPLPFPSLGLGVQMRMDRPAAAALGTSVSLDASTSRREGLSNSGPLDVLPYWSLGVPPGSNAALTDLTSPTSSFMPDVPGFYRVRVENAVPSTNHRSEVSKVVGFGTGFQYFESAHVAFNASTIGDPVLADLDGDGNGDIAARGTSPSSGEWVIHVLLGGHGTVVPAAEFPIDNGVEQLLHGDLDGDGLHDLVGLSSETLYVAYLRDPITASTWRAIPLDRGPACGFAASLWAGMADRDNDGRAELLVADSCRLAILTWRHPPGGALSLDREQGIPQLHGRPVVFGDLTKDGRADFVVPREPALPQDALLVFTQNASGDFSLRQTLEGVRAGASAIGDVTGDGLADLVVVREPVLSVFEQQLSGALAPAADYTVGRIAAIAPRFADLNDDGRTDLVAVRERDDLLIGLQQPQGPLAFVTLLDDLEQNSDSAAVPADFNGDGRVDLVRRRHVMHDVGFSVRLRAP